MIIPSLVYLNVIADTCHAALGTYLLCCQLANPDTHNVTLTPHTLTDYHVTRTTTLNNLRKLAHCGLLNYHDDYPNIHITLASDEAHDLYA